MASGRSDAAADIGPDLGSRWILPKPYANEIVSAHFDGRRQLDVLIWNLFSLELWHRWYRYGTCAPDDIGATQFLDTEPVSGALKETLG